MVVHRTVCCARLVEGVGAGRLRGLGHPDVFANEFYAPVTLRGACVGPYREGEASAAGAPAGRGDGDPVLVTVDIPVARAAGTGKMNGVGAPIVARGDPFS